MKNLAHAPERYGALTVTAIYTAAALVAWPFSGITQGDDFSYARTALDFSRSGHIIYNGWASMMLGWQALWGAAAIQLFGFSFNTLRLSMLVLSMASVYVFYNILVRFGVKNAAFGTLTLALTPLFMPLSVSFFSDIPGLLSVLLCVAMCQRAFSANSSKATLCWLIAASTTNLMTGTVRQICWLGALVMVPATGCLLRRRRGATLTVILLWVVSLVFVLGCLRWYARQPYSVPEHILLGHVGFGAVKHLGAQYLKVSLYLLLITLPVSIAWLATWRSLTRKTSARVLFLVLLIVASTAISVRHGSLPNYVMPWLVPMLSSQGMITSTPPIVDIVTVNLAARAIISLLVVVEGIICIQKTRFWQREHLKRFYARNKALVWILFPFAISVVCLVSPRGMFTFVQDRYLLLLIPVLLAVLLRVYEDTVSPVLPAISYGALAIFAYYAIAGLHDREATSRAQDKAMAALKDAGIARNRIAEGFGPDEWYEIARAGHVNADVPVHPPKEQFVKTVTPWTIPEVCVPFDYYLIPHIHPDFILKAFAWGSATGACYQPSSFAPIQYTAWAFPFHRAIYTLAAKAQ